MAGRRRLHGLSVGALGLGFALAPLTVATASTTAHHTANVQAAAKKSSSSLCRDLKAQQASSNKVGSSISAAITSGNLPAAKKRIIDSINAGLKQASPILNRLNAAPRNVQSAVRGLIKLDQTLISAIRKTTTLSQLEAPFAVLAKNPHLTAYVTTVTSYIKAQCGSILPTTTPIT